MPGQFFDSSCSFQADIVRAGVKKLLDKLGEIQDDRVMVSCGQGPDRKFYLPTLCDIDNQDDWEIERYCFPLRTVLQKALEGLLKGISPDVEVVRLGVGRGYDKFEYDLPFGMFPYVRKTLTEEVHVPFTRDPDGTCHLWPD